MQLHQFLVDAPLDVNCQFFQVGFFHVLVATWSIRSIHLEIKGEIDHG